MHSILGCTGKTLVKTPRQCLTATELCARVTIGKAMGTNRTSTTHKPSSPHSIVVLLRRDATVGFGCARIVTKPSAISSTLQCTCDASCLGLADSLTTRTTSKGRTRSAAAPISCRRPRYESCPVERRLINLIFRIN